MGTSSSHASDFTVHALPRSAGAWQKVSARVDSPHGGSRRNMHEVRDLGRLDSAGSRPQGTVPTVDRRDRFPRFQSRRQRFWRRPAETARSSGSSNFICLRLNNVPYRNEMILPYWYEIIFVRRHEVDFGRCRG